MRLVRFPTRPAQISPDIRAALTSLGRGDGSVGGIGLVGVRPPGMDEPVDAVIVTAHGVVVVVGVDLPDPAIRLDAPLHGVWKADEWPLLSKDPEPGPEAGNPSGEALAVSERVTQRLRTATGASAVDVGTVIAVGPFVEHVEQPADELSGPVRIVYPTATSLLAAIVSLTARPWPLTAEQARAVLEALSPDTEIDDETLVGEGFTDANPSAATEADNPLADDADTETLHRRAPTGSASGARAGTDPSDPVQSTTAPPAPSPIAQAPPAASPPGPDTGETASNAAPASPLPAAAGVTNTTSAAIASANTGTGAGVTMAHSTPPPTPARVGAAPGDTQRAGGPQADAAPDAHTGSVPAAAAARLHAPEPDAPGPRAPGPRASQPHTPHAHTQTHAQPASPGKPASARSGARQRPQAVAAQPAAADSAGPAPTAPPRRPGVGRQTWRRRPSVLTWRGIAVGAAFLVALVVIITVAVLSGGDERNEPVGMRAGGLEFTQRAAQITEECSAHAVGDLSVALADGGCTELRRGSFDTTVRGTDVAVSVAALTFTDAQAAQRFLEVADTPGTGTIHDLATTSRRWAPPAPDWSGAAYVSDLEGATVRLVLASPRDASSPGRAPNDSPEVTEAANAALGLVKLND